MFRTAILRTARLPRATGASRVVLASLRPATVQATNTAAAAAAATHFTPIGSHFAPLASSWIAARRAYSTADAADAPDAAAATLATESVGPIDKFGELVNIGVSQAVVDQITRGMKYQTMTPVQSMTITPALAGRDMVAQAKTGTGKTLAFLIPTLQSILTDEPNLDRLPDRFDRRRSRIGASDIRAIVISPTRELAEQIGKEAIQLARGTRVKVQVAVGGTQRRQMVRQALFEGCHLLVATPGRLNDLLSDGESGFAAPNLKTLVLDEADRMLDVGFEQELRNILRFLPNRRDVPRQTLLFSATIPRNVVSLAREYVDPGKFEFVQTIDPNDAPTHHKVPQHIVPVRGYENLFPTLLELIRREIAAAKAARATDKDAMPFKAIVFLSTTNMVLLTSQIFRKLVDQVPELPKMFQINSKLTQTQRTAAANLFRKSDSGILFSSDVTARGMDFPNVTHVIQLGVPPDRDQYIHRLGRTGRADKSGQGWLIVADDEIDHARRVLQELPIKRASDLTNQKHEVTPLKAAEGEDEVAIDSNQPVEVAMIKRAVDRVPKDLLNDTYMSFFGGATRGTNQQVIVNLLNDWVTKGWGWEEPPAISRNIAERRGLLRLRGLNIVDRMQRRPRFDRDDDGFGGDNGFTDGPGSGDRNSNDVDDFESKFFDASRDDGFRGGRSGSRGGSGGFSRGGSGGGYSRGGHGDGYGKNGGFRSGGGNRFNNGRNDRRNGSSNRWDGRGRQNNRQSSF